MQPGWMDKSTGAVKETDVQPAQTGELPSGGREGGDSTKQVGEPWEWDLLSQKAGEYD